MKNLNAELDEFAPPSDLKSLAGRGIRGEFLFPVPCILEANPYLLGYYRLLLGFSQKEFYNKGKLTRFSVMEEKGILNVRAKADLPGLCRAFAKEASYLLENLGVERFSMEFLDDLTLLTLGPQLRGGINTMIGKLANQIVFDIIRDLIAHSVTSRTGVRMEVLNASQRQVSIAFSADPDISITERLSAQSIRNIVELKSRGAQTSPISGTGWAKPRRAINQHAKGDFRSVGRSVMFRPLTSERQRRNRRLRTIFIFCRLWLIHCQPNAPPSGPG